MLSMVEAIWHLLADGETLTVSTVVTSSGSSPREVGASMVMTSSGRVLGSLSGGCLEGDVLHAAHDVMQTGTTHASMYGPVDGSDPFRVGLSCGGLIDVATSRFTPENAAIFARLHNAVSAHQAAAVVTDIGGDSGSAGVMGYDGQSAFGSLGTRELDAVVSAQLSALAEQGFCGIIRLGADGRRDRQDKTLFVESARPRPKMLIVGAIDVADALTRYAWDYRTTVLDPRPLFATPERFPHASDVIPLWPDKFFEEWPIDAETVVVVLTHDPRVDVPVLLRALRSPARFVGAMGSTTTHFDRLDRLRRAGTSEAELSHLHSPIGLDIGARTPSEIALAILAEVVASKSGKLGFPMTLPLTHSADR